MTRTLRRRASTQRRSSRERKVPVIFTEEYKQGTPNNTTASSHESCSNGSSEITMNSSRRKSFRIAKRKSEADQMPPHEVSYRNDNHNRQKNSSKRTVNLVSPEEDRRTRSSSRKSKGKLDENKKRRIDKEDEKQEVLAEGKQVVETVGGEVGRPVCVSLGSDDEADKESAYWEVEAILGRRQGLRKRYEYLVRWKNCPESHNTWEPARNLCDTAWKMAKEFDKLEKEREKRRKEDEEKLGLADEMETPESSVAASKEGTPSYQEALSCERDEDLEWEWDDKEQLRFQEVERINVSTSCPEEKAILQERVTHARMNGTPVILTGHPGWAQFASRWMKPKSARWTPKNDYVFDPADRRLVFDLNVMMDDIGAEDVPIVRRNYDESSPIHGCIQASKFIKQGFQTETKKLYLHQWQFPLSDTAGRKLCHQHHPLHVLGDDLLKYWLDLPQCKGDSPLQYIFMGREDTYSKLHRDDGGLAITIAPIFGRKECTLVHRNDAACLYHLNASLDEPDLQRYPLLAYARIWRTELKPGEILIMPEGTYHQCRNTTPCLSYSRFHLDEVNLPAFVRSMFDQDAPEIAHDEILWNAVYEIIQKVDQVVDRAQKALKEKRPIESLPDAELRYVKTLRSLRHTAREVARQLCLDREMNNDRNSSLPYEGTALETTSSRDWDDLVNDIDLCLHEFRYRKEKTAPKFRKRKLKPHKNMDDKKRAVERRSRNVPYDEHFELAYQALPDLETESGSDQEISSDDIAIGDRVVARLEKKKVEADVLDVVPDLLCAYLTYDEFPAIFDQYVPIDKLKTIRDRQQIQQDALKPGMLVLNRSSLNNEVVPQEYRAVVQFISTEKMVRVKFIGVGTNTIRWIPTSAILHRKSETDAPGAKVQDLMSIDSRSDRSISPVPTSNRRSTRKR